MQPAATRREFMQLLATAALLAPAAGSVAAHDALPLLGRLIAQSRTQPDVLSSVSARMDYISHALLGVRYRADTLIGGPRRRERFVVRDDAFDCVTFCEVVLAAAMAQDFDAFETALRRIRYDHGHVQWKARNHYFAQWSARNVGNGICMPVAIEPVLTIEKTVNWSRALGRRRVSIAAVARRTLLDRRDRLAAGDIIGFISARPNLDFFHTGLVAFGADGALQLRHASQSRGRVVEEEMERFVALNPVRYVALLRPAGETASG